MQFADAHGERVPLLFNIHEDPSEGLPINLVGFKTSLAGIHSELSTTYACNATLPRHTEGQPDTFANYATVCNAIMKAYAHELATFVPGHLVAPPLLPSEKDGVAICCDRSKKCDCNGAPNKIIGTY